MSFQDLINNYRDTKKKLQEFRSALDRQAGYRDSLKNSISDFESRGLSLGSDLDLDNKIVQLFQAVSEQSQSQMGKIEIICSDALKDIMSDPDIEFKIKTEKKRNALDTYFYVNDKKAGELDLMQCEAGAVKNIISVGLRLIFLELYDPKIDGPVILDEVGVNISIDFQQSFGKFLRKFSDLTGRQIIMVTHWKSVISEATTKIDVSKPNNRSIVNE